MSDSIAIKVEGLNKTFKLPHDKTSSLKNSLIGVFKKRRGYELQEALENINFEIKRGEFYGIVGKNGGGKSTLLKIISGIYNPTKGNVQINGKLTPFIELGVGFNPELTGRENVFLNGALLGFNRQEMIAMYRDIVTFAELERFMDQKLKNYSSGMQVRLAFSIAIRAKSDILVMDEVLAVGDAAFQRKCFDIFRQLKKEGRTIVLVTHDMSNVEKFCDRVLVIDKGKQLAVTTPAKAASMYAQMNVDEEGMTRQDAKHRKESVRYGTKGVEVEKATVLCNGKRTKIFSSGEPFTLRLQVNRKKEYATSPVLYGLAFYNEDGVTVLGPNSRSATLKPDATSVNFTIPRLMLAPGEYKVTIALYNEDLSVFDFLEKWISFSVVSDHQIAGLVELDSTWE